MSPAMYRRILKPIHADYIAFIRERTKAKVFFHTDGDVFDLLDDFVEIGVDILNPVQSGSGKLGNLAEVKRRYGTRLAFCGAIDTQHVLPTGTPEQVRAEVRRAIGDPRAGRRLPPRGGAHDHERGAARQRPGHGRRRGRVRDVPASQVSWSVAAFVGAARRLSARFGCQPCRPGRAPGSSVR